MLASVARGEVELPVPNEPLRLSHAASRVPTSTRDVVLSSTVRHYQLELGSAVVVPWRDSSGRGWLIAGTLPESWNTGTLDLARARGFASRLRDKHEVAGLEGALRLRGDVAHAVRFVAEAGVTSDDVGVLLEAVVVAARMLLGTSVAYTSLPEPDSDAFVFATLLNIKTSPFRRLRMRIGQGLGGFTAEQLRTVRSLNYAEDSRLRDAPVEETLGEGILSAMCTPLIADGEILGLLYVGNRHLTPFTRTDVSLIEEFGAHATLGLKARQVESHRIELARKREQERLASDLHDSVVRALVEIGFHAREGLVVPTDPTLRNRLSIISHAAELCLEELRDQIAVLSPTGAGAGMTVTELFESFRQTHCNTAEPSLVARGLEPWQRLPPEIAEGALRIGREALDNAALHAQAARRELTLAIVGGQVVLTVVDDGCGVPAGDAERFVTHEPRHFGLRGMRRTAERLGGTVSFVSPPEGGFVVEARIPLARAPS